MPSVDIRGVREQPWPDFSRLRGVHDDQRSEDDVADGEDSQESPSVELSHEKEASPRVALSDLPTTDQDSRDEEPAQHEEELDTEVSQVQSAHYEGVGI